jgi:hypothetical protein
VARVVDCLPGMPEALGSVPRTVKINKQTMTQGQGSQESYSRLSFGVLSGPCHQGGGLGLFISFGEGGSERLWWAPSPRAAFEQLALPPPIPHSFLEEAQRSPAVGPLLPGFLFGSRETFGRLCS